MVGPGRSLLSPLRIAVLIPCYNEEAAVGTVVRDFRAALPSAVVYVYDNNSRDETRRIAEQAGAVVRRESQQGKGFIVRRMFSDVEADVYVLVDGDDTYDAGAAREMVSMLVSEQLDMVVGRRVSGDEAVYRRGHRLGNRMFTRVVAHLFGQRFEDILSGYRVFSRRFVKSFPISARGFEIEAEMTIHALTLDVRIREIDTEYRRRPEGSRSKLNTYRDGIGILKAIVLLYKEEHPLPFFSFFGGVLVAMALALMYPVIMEYLDTGLVPRFPTAILATGMVLSGLFSFACGMILDTVTRGRREVKLLAYLSIPVVGDPGVAD